MYQRLFVLVLLGLDTHCGSESAVTIPGQRFYKPRGNSGVGILCSHSIGGQLPSSISIYFSPLEYLGRLPRLERISFKYFKRLGRNISFPFFSVKHMRDGQELVCVRSLSMS